MKNILKILNPISDKLFEHRRTIFKLKNIVVFFLVVHLLSCLYSTYESGYCVNCTELTAPKVGWGQDALEVQEKLETFNNQKVYRPFANTQEYLISFSLIYFPTLLYFIFALGLTYTAIRFVGLLIGKVFFGDESQIRRLSKIFETKKKR
tara:strand:+ start:2395 stop:2844 length:450 start_codon:yes stop_codon:yes gene_type:complete